MILTTKTRTRDKIESSKPVYTPIVKPWFYEVVLTDVLVEDQSVVDDCKRVIAFFLKYGNENCLKNLSFLCETNLC